MIKENHNNQLKYTDLVGIASKIGVEKDMNITLCKMLINTHKTYGSKYFIKKATELVSNPKRHGFHFPSSLGKIVLINYCTAGYKHFNDKNYYEAIKKFSNNHDEQVKAYAKATLNKLDSN